ncbi:MAG: hypothetical protein AB7G93_09705 [Bdellovibrionales bacterium]
MFRRRILTRILLLLVLATLYFQNCARWEPVTSETTQFSQQIFDPHSDRDHWTADTMREKVVTSSAPILADRIYIMALLENIFGPSAKTLLDANIGLARADFGSPCSIYEQYKYERASDRQLVRANASEACAYSASADHLGASQNASAAVTRQATMNRVCVDLVMANATMNFALKRIDSAASVPAPSSENLLRLVRLFYVDKPDPEQGVIDSLRILFTPDAPSVDEWRAAIQMVCASSYWQVL